MSYNGGVLLELTGLRWRRDAGRDPAEVHLTSGGTLLTEAEKLEDRTLDGRCLIGGLFDRSKQDDDISWASTGRYFSVLQEQRSTPWLVGWAAGLPVWMFNDRFFLQPDRDVPTDEIRAALRAMVKPVAPLEYVRDADGRAFPASIELHGPVVIERMTCFPREEDGIAPSVDLILELRVPAKHAAQIEVQVLLLHEGGVLATRRRVVRVPAGGREFCEAGLQAHMPADASFDIIARAKRYEL